MVIILPAGAGAGGAPTAVAEHHYRARDWPSALPAPEDYGEID
jgi:hypothetical protein